jgi:hypothetical protein
VIEREPVAHVQPSYLLDADGVAMMPVEPQQRSVPLQAGERYPVITGINPNELRVGRSMESPQVRAALRFLTAFEHSAMAPLVDIARVDISAPDVLVVTTLQQNEVTLSTMDFEKQLNRWFLIHTKGQEQARQIAMLDLSVADNVPLRWLDSALTVPTAPKLRKTSPYKKKHV